MFNRFELGFFQRNKQQPETPQVTFDFPVDEDPAVIAQSLQHAIIERGIVADLPVAPLVPSDKPLNAEQVVAKYLENHQGAEFKGDDFVTEGGSLPKSLEVAIKGTSKPVLFRELYVNPTNGAMAETVVAVAPDTEAEGTQLQQLESRWLRSPETPVFLKGAPRTSNRLTAVGD